MLRKEFFNRLGEQITSILPLAHDTKTKLLNEIGALLQQELGEVVISREEFSTQAKQLERAEAKLAQLERRLQELSE
jgi:BMFP domain-containing protein YqiC